MNFTGVRAINWLRRGVVFVAFAVAVPAWGAGADGTATCTFEDGTIVFEPKPLEPGFVLQTAKAAPDSDLVYELLVDSCDERRCQLELRLTDGETVYDRKSFADILPTWLCVSTEGYLPDGESLLSPDVPISWAAEVPKHKPIFFGITPVALAPGVRGLLAHIKEGGFPGEIRERPWEDSFLLYTVDDRFAPSWRFGEGFSEYSYSNAAVTVDVRDVEGDGYSEFLAVRRFLTDDDREKGMGGTVTTKVYRWNNDTKEMETFSMLEAGVPLHAHIAGVYASAEEAIDVKKRFCADSYDVYSTEWFPRLERDKFIVAKLAWRPELLDTVGGWCRPNGDGFVAALKMVGPARAAGDDQPEKCDDLIARGIFDLRPLQRRYVLETVKAADDDALSYDISVAPCGKRRCPIEVRLTDGETVYDSHALDVSSGLVEPCVSSEDYLPGAGDPITRVHNRTAWWTRGEGAGLKFGVLPIDLAPGLRGLFVHVLGGYEHTWTKHYLFVAVDKRLVLAWNESNDDYSSVRVDTRDIDGDGFSEMLFFGRYLSTSDSVKGYGGRITAIVYRWDNDAKQLEKLSLARAGVPLYAHIAGQYDTASEALAVRNNGPLCEDYYKVYSTDQFPQLQRGKFIVAKLSWRRELLDEVGGWCRPKGNGFVAELMFVADR